MTVAYHCAPTEARQAIQRTGLRAPVYCFLDLGNAQWYNDEYVNGDIWSFGIAGLQIEADPEFQIELGAADGFRLTEPIRTGLTMVSSYG